MRTILWLALLFSLSPAESWSPQAQALVKRAFNDINPALKMDYHVHVIGLGDSGTGCFIHPDYQSLLHPVKYAKFSVYLAACGVQSSVGADQAFLSRFVERIADQPAPGKYLALPLDMFHDSKGLAHPEKTEFYVPNDYVFSITRRYPQYFIQAISVHPRRKDALAALEVGARQGAKAVKWLPSAMGIDPSDPVYLPFYKKMAALGMVLLTHGGEEQAMEAAYQHYGNPLLLRPALNAGVKVIVYHCASLGVGADLDHPGGPPVKNFDLFLRLMDEKKYEGRLFGEISGITQANRGAGPLYTLLKRTDLHSRLVNGSDYPIPGVNLLIRLSPFVEYGFLTREEADALREIFNRNPLLFDFVLKRTLRDPDTGKRFPASMFIRNAALF